MSGSSEPVSRGLRPHPAPKVLGILSIVFGGIVLLMMLVSMTLLGMGPLEDMPGASLGAVQRYADALEPSATIILITMTAMSAALIAIGIGQLRYRRWAGTASTVWSIVGLLVLVGQTVNHFLVTVPALSEFLGSLSGDSEMARVMEGATGAGAIINVLLYVPYPIILLVIMRKPAVVEAMNR